MVSSAGCLTDPRLFNSSLSRLRTMENAVKQYALVRKADGQPVMVGRKLYYDNPGRIRAAIKTSWRSNHYLNPWDSKTHERRDASNEFEIVEFELQRTSKEAEQL